MADKKCEACAGSGYEPVEIEGYDNTCKECYGTGSIPVYKNKPL